MNTRRWSASNLPQRAGPREWDRALSQLGDSVRRLRSELSCFSDLDQEQLHLFSQFWGGLAEEKKLQLLDSLGRAARNSLHVHFDRVFNVGMGDPSPRVRLSAVSKYVNYEKAGTRALLRLALEDPDPSVRLAAVRSLGSHCSLVALGAGEPAREELLLTGLLKIFHNPLEPVRIRQHALRCVGYFLHENVTAAIRQGLTMSGFQGAAVEAMGHNGDPQWLQELLALSFSPRARLREEVAFALGELFDNGAIPRLVEMVEDPDRKVMRGAIRSLGQLGGQAARLTLLRLKGSIDPEVRFEATEALEELEEEYPEAAITGPSLN